MTFVLLCCFVVCSRAQRGFLNGTFGPACCGHPSIEVDTAMAKSGAAFIKQTLGW
jgi:hypothetical protein